jgi:hypothetical protein
MHVYVSISSLVYHHLPPQCDLTYIHQTHARTHAHTHLIESLGNLHVIASSLESFTSLCLVYFLLPCRISQNSMSAA